MTTADWFNTPNGLAVPPARPGPRRDTGSPDILREAHGILSQAYSEFREHVELRENIGGFGDGSSLGARSWNAEGSFGEQGFSAGAAEEVLRSLAEYLTTIQGGFYGSQYGYGYGSSSLQVGDVVKQISSLIWVFPEYNPLIKQMCVVRSLYVFGQGFEVRGESKRKKKARIRLLQEARLQKEIDAQVNAQISSTPDPGDETGAMNGNGSNGSNGGGPDMARNALFQKYGATGQGSSQPKGRREQMREEIEVAERAGPMNLYMLMESYAERYEVDVDELINRWSSAAPSANFLESVIQARANVLGQPVEELVEAYSGAGGGQQGARMSTGSQYRLLGSDKESPIAECVRELWEDACNMDRFCSVESAQRADQQKMIEGNLPIVMRSKGKGKTPELMVWPTYALNSVIHDDLSDGTGAPLGYMVNVGSTQGEAGTRSGQVVYPDMVSDNVPRLRMVMDRHGRDYEGYEIDENYRVLHLKEWGPVWRGFGLPGIMASLNSASRYMSYTAEWVVMQRIWRTYALLITGQGNNRQLNQIQSNYANRLNGLFSGAVGTETNSATGLSGVAPMAQAAISGMNPAGIGGTRIEPLRTAGSTDPPAMGREIRLLGEMGVGLPDNMFSDTNVGTMSRADVLERNTHLQFLSAQQGYARAFKVISRCAVKFRLGDESLDDVDIVVTWPAMVTPSTIEQAGTILQMFQGNLIPHKLAVEEALKLLKREDMHEHMQILFPRDEDGMEFYQDMQMAMMPGPGQMGGPAGGPSPGGDPNNPLAAVESLLLDNEWLGRDLIYG